VEYQRSGLSTALYEVDGSSQQFGHYQNNDTAVCTSTAVITRRSGLERNDFGREEEEKGRKYNNNNDFEGWKRFPGSSAQKKKKKKKE
jgi:hypothetical protein